MLKSLKLNGQGNLHGPTNFKKAQKKFFVRNFISLIELQLEQQTFLET